MKTFKQIQEELQKLSGSKGSNPGGIFKDSDTNKEYYIKHPNVPEQAHAEVLASKIHNLMGLHTLNPEVRSINGKTSVVTEYNRNIEPLKAKHISSLSNDNHKHLGNMYAAGVLTKNWDIVGTGIEYDQGNIFKHKNSDHLISGDTGGSFHFRAQGGHKDYGSDIAEKDSLLNPDISEGSHFFNHALAQPGVKEHVKNTLQNLDMNKVQQAFKESGLDNYEELHKNFVERHKKLLDSFSK